MSNRNRDERLNEKADEALELLKECARLLYHDSVLSQECIKCKIKRLIGWIEKGNDWIEEEDDV